VSSCFTPNEVPLVVKDAISREMAAQTLNWQVFTDGASSPDGRGGWAYVVVKDDIEIRRGQGSALGVTHQRMEIRAVAEALLAFPQDVPVKVIGDSAYAIDCFKKKWYVRWEQNGWRNSSGKPVANGDEWERVLAALRVRSAEPTWRRVPGHGKGKYPWNDLADALAVEAKGLLP
jgi:ribonuclease HI